ncbi:hypothetical protein [Duncaniella dubosii]|uniref:hypothetical protein n=1 Tax=Duncaniella dubosii TaxID=2518971 RepID=UPI003F67BD8B
MRSGFIQDQARKQSASRQETTTKHRKQIIGTDSNKRVTAGLLTYPTSWPSTSSSRKLHKVPSEKIRNRHLDLTAVFARRFNSFYGGDSSPNPQNFNFGGTMRSSPRTRRSGKMARAKATALPSSTRKGSSQKVMRAVTDEGP